MSWSRILQPCLLKDVVGFADRTEHSEGDRAQMWFVLPRIVRLRLSLDALPAEVQEMRLSDIVANTIARKMYRTNKPVPCTNRSIRGRYVFDCPRSLSSAIGERRSAVLATGTDSKLGAGTGNVCAQATPRSGELSAHNDIDTPRCAPPCR